MYKKIHKNSNTSDAIIEFLDYIYSSLDSKQSTIAVYLEFSKAFDTFTHNILMSKLCIMAPEVSCSTGVSLIWVTGNNTSQSKTAIPLCQTLQWVFHKDRCWAQYSFFSISMTFIDPQTRWVLFILLMIQQFFLWLSK